jgi:general secretion pathway protein H
MRAPGFTLIEMLVVLAIMAIVVAAAPALLSSLQGARLRAAADDLTAGLRAAHSQAVSRGTTTELLLDAAHHRYRISTQPATTNGLAAVQAVDVAPRSLVGADGIVHVRFAADGSASAARLALHRGARTIVLVVDWLTGTVHRDE